MNKENKSVTKQLEGIIFNIQRFTVHDGPGIRTEIFFKGCPLKCKWCSNPESINANTEIGVYANRCIGTDKCGLCLTTCPESPKPFIIEDKTVTTINRQTCVACGKCADACPANALVIWGKKMTVPEVMEVILKDMPYYQKSGGGVTLSGGEVLLQWRFARELLQECRKHGIHTCVESSLHIKPEILEEILPFIDLVITDIKHMDSAQHLINSGVGNELILENIKRVVLSNSPLIIRIPVIPDHNNSEDNIRATAEFIRKELNNRVLQVQLLPYRQLGTEKYASLGLKYPMPDNAVVERSVWEKNIKELAEIMKTYKIPAVAGTTTSVKLEVNT